MWLYIKVSKGGEPDAWEVGFFYRDWHTASLHQDEADARCRVNYLNGGDGYGEGARRAGAAGGGSAGGAGGAGGASHYGGGA